MRADGDSEGDHVADVFEYVVRGSHRSLVRSLPHPELPVPGGAAFDRGLVVVPVARPEPLLGTAAEVACALGWSLLLLCSRDNNARRVYLRVRRDWPELEVTVADLLHRDLLRAHREWRTGGHWAARQRMDVDTNRKRNIGLAASRMTGHAWVLFVDDDVLRLSTAHVEAALAYLTSTHRRHVVGWALDQYPDNSVVHHARRDVLGLHQDVFIGGAALLVRVEGWEPPGFPPIYNEDWLFLYSALAMGEVAAGPDVGQQTFDPYRDPLRARSEEFGDILGEGLFHLLHVGSPVDVAGGGRYWHSVHAKRTRLLSRILRELRRQHERAPSEAQQARIGPALAAVEESRKQLTRATPESLADFVRRWQHDEVTWHEFYERLPERDTLRDALVYLGLHEAWIVTSAGSPAQRAEDVS